MAALISPRTANLRSEQMTSKEPVTFQSANKRFLSIASISGLFYIRNPLVKLLFSKISSFLFTFTFSLLFTLVFNFIYSSVRGSRLGQLTDQIRLRTQTISVGGISCKQESCSTKSVDRRRGSWIELRRLSWKRNLTTGYQWNRMKRTVGRPLGSSTSDAFTDFLKAIIN